MSGQERRRFNTRERIALWLLAAGKCPRCGADLGRSFHADHVTAYSKGGPTDLDNGEALCPRCNLSKGDS